MTTSDERSSSVTVTMSIYQRVADAAGVSYAEAEQACDELRGYGLAVQTYGSPSAIVKALRATGLLPPQKSASGLELS